MTPMEEVIEALEKATEESRALDTRIAVLVFRAADPDALHAEAAAEDCAIGTYWIVHRAGWRSLTTAQPYTTSLDAAMTLVREAMSARGSPLWTRQVDFRHDSRDEWVKVEITVPSREFQGHCMGKDCEARATVAAALRARLASGETK